MDKEEYKRRQQEIAGFAKSEGTNSVLAGRSRNREYLTTAQTGWGR
jgi:hypothetical protein